MPQVRILSPRPERQTCFLTDGSVFFYAPKWPFASNFDLLASVNPYMHRVLCLAGNINLTIVDFKERMEQRMAIPYGLKKMPDGNVKMVSAEIEVVQGIYQLYLDGASLGSIAKELEADQVVAPSGNAKWSRSVIDKILSNGKYVPYAISMELFVAAQFEKDSRSNTQINSDGSTQRKAARYSSQNVLSGLLICAECGANFRRITRPSGEVVWRCASRVEHGKEICKHAPTILESSLKEALCKHLNMDAFDEDTVSQMLDFVSVQENGDLLIQYKEQEFAQMMHH